MNNLIQWSNLLKYLPDYDLLQKSKLALKQFLKWIYSITIE